MRLCGRFLIANDFLQNVDTAPLVFPTDDVAAPPGGLPPMQQILDVEVSDEEHELVKDGDKVDSAAAAAGSAQEPRGGCAAAVDSEGAVGAKEDTVNGGAQADVDRAMPSVTKDANKVAGPCVGSAVAVDASAEARAENPEEIVLAD